MSVVWLVTLPQLIDAESFGLKKGETVLRSENDIGLAKVRRRFTKGVDILSVSFTMTTAQLALFEDFFDVDLNGGATTIAFDHPITGVPSEFRIVGTPDYKPRGGEYFVVTMQWELIP